MSTTLRSYRWLPLLVVAGLGACRSGGPALAARDGTAARVACRPDSAALGRLQQVADSVVRARPDVRGVAVHVIAPARCLANTVVAGLADSARGTPLSAATPVRIASNTKTYVAAAVLRLVEDGRIGIDDPVERHLSAEHLALLRQRGYDPAAITVRHLLTHTAGLPDHAQDEEGYIGAIIREPRKRWTRTEQLRLAMVRGTRVGAPGAAFSYSDTGYILLGELLERVIGQPLARAVRSVLGFERLGLVSTWWETLEPAPAGVPARAHQFFGEHDTYDWDASNDLYGGGGLAATAADMATFTRAVFGGRAFRRPETLALMQSSPVAPPPGRGGYGMGVMDRTVDGVRTWGHSGYWGTVAFHAPQPDVTVAAYVLQNRAVRLTGVLERAALAVARGEGAAPAR